VKRTADFDGSFSPDFIDAPPNKYKPTNNWYRCPKSSEPRHCDALAARDDKAFYACTSETTSPYCQVSTEELSACCIRDPRLIGRGLLLPSKILFRRREPPWFS
jgi:hypothetical protein